MEAADYNEADIMKALIKAGADLSVLDHEGWDAKEFAEQAGKKGRGCRSGRRCGHIRGVCVDVTTVVRC